MPRCVPWRRGGESLVSPRREILAGGEPAAAIDGTAQHDGAPFEGERAFEIGIRPKRLADFVGQQLLREKLEIILEAARRRGQPVDHVLFAGPPGPRKDHAGRDHGL